MPAEVNGNGTATLEPRIRPTGIVGMQPKAEPAPEPEVEDFEAELWGQEAEQERYRKLTDHIAKFPDPGTEAKKPVAAKPKAEAPKPVPEEEDEETPAAPSVPKSLQQRAEALGWTEEEIGEYPNAAALSRDIGIAERALAKQSLQRQAPVEKQEPEPAPPEKPKVPSLWKDAAEKEGWDKDTVALLDRMNETLHATMQEQLRELREQVQYANQFVQHQVAESGRSQLDKLTDQLADEGWKDVFGKGRAKPGTPQHDAKVKLSKLLAAEMKAYAELGEQLDLEDAARVVARRLYGDRQATGSVEDAEDAEYEEPQRPTPRQQKAAEQPRSNRGRFQRPSARKAPTGTGRQAAVEAVTGFLSVNGNSLGDIHGQVAE